MTWVLRFLQLCLPAAHSVGCPCCYDVGCSGGKLGLSIRDVDQATGRDLLDLDKIRAAQVTSKCGVASGITTRYFYYLHGPGEPDSL